MSTAKTKSDVVTATVRMDPLRLVSIGLAVIGLLIAGYLSWAEVTGNQTVCANTGKIDCDTVQTSAYAETLGVPVAVMGLLGFTVILGLLLFEDQGAFLATYGRTIVIGMALFAFIFQSYLTYVEASVLDAWCQWCVASYVVVTILLGISGFRLYQFLKPLQA